MIFINFKAFLKDNCIYDGWKNIHCTASHVSNESIEQANNNYATATDDPVCDTLGMCNYFCYCYWICGTVLLMMLIAMNDGDDCWCTILCFYCIYGMLILIRTIHNDDDSDGDCCCTCMCTCRPITFIITTFELIIITCYIKLIMSGFEVKDIYYCYNVIKLGETIIPNTKNGKLIHCCV